MRRTWLVWASAGAALLGGLLIPWRGASPPSDPGPRPGGPGARPSADGALAELPPRLPAGEAPDGEVGRVALAPASRTDAFTPDPARPLRVDIEVDDGTSRAHDAELHVLVWGGDQDSSDHLDFVRSCPIRELPARVAAEELPGLRLMQTVELRGESSVRIPSYPNAGFTAVMLLGDLIRPAIDGFEARETAAFLAHGMKLRTESAGHVTFELDFPPWTSGEERALLCGATLSLFDLSSKGPVDADDSPWRHLRLNCLDATREKVAGLPPRVVASVQGLDDEVWEVSGGAGWPQLVDSERRGPLLVGPGVAFRPEPGTRSTVRVPLVRGRAVEGFVVDPDGAPLRGVTLLAHSRESYEVNGHRADGDATHFTTSTEHGRFRFPAVYREVTSLEVEVDDFPPFELGAEALDSQLRTGGPLHVVVPAPYRLPVRILFPDGTPAAGLRVLGSEEGAPDAGAVSAVTDDLGAATLGPFRGDSLVLEAGAFATRAEDGSLRFPDPPPDDTPGPAALWQLRRHVDLETLVADRPLTVELVQAPRIRGLVSGLEPGEQSTLRIHAVTLDSFRRRRGRPWTSSGWLVVGRRAVQERARATGEFDFQVAEPRVAVFATVGQGTGTVRLSSAVEFERAEGTQEVTLSFQGSPSVPERDR